VANGNGNGGAEAEWSSERKAVTIRGASGIIALLIVALLAVAAGAVKMDQARALEHQSMVEELRLTNYLLNLQLPPDRRLAIPPPGWLDDWARARTPERTRERPH